MSDKKTSELLNNGRFVTLVDDLTRELSEKTFRFLIDRLEEKEGANDIFLLILNAHLRSLFINLRRITKGDQESSEAADAFIKSIKNHISTMVG